MSHSNGNGNGKNILNFVPLFVFMFAINVISACELRLFSCVRMLVRGVCAE